MKFGPVSVTEAAGAVLAHAVEAGGRRWRKASVLSEDDVAALREAGVETVVAAALEAGDVAEDEAARRVASLLTVDNIEVKPAATGRVNLHARSAGVFTVDKRLIDEINSVDPSVTLATVAPFAAVERGRMVATVKIIPFAVPGGVLDRVEAIAAGRPAFAVHPYRSLAVGLVQTALSGTKASVLDKTARVTEARLRRSGSALSGELRTPHDSAAVAAAIRAMAADSDMVVVFGASAMSDPADVVPAAIERAGGTVLRSGMPVDPGNLIVVGELDGKPVLGAPGCARSPKENGFDWVLDRLAAGIPVGDADIAGMGVGGLLMEIPTRPQPRETARPAREARPLPVHAVVLAAGRSSRMGGPNKLLALFGGEPLIRRTVARVLASRAAGTVVVTGHQADRIGAALFGLDLQTVVNPDFASGLASSLKAGIARLPDEAAGALVVLGDMPAVEADDLDRLLAAFDKAGGRAIVRATHDGRRGNPVVLPRSVFSAVARLEGDTGARHLVEAGEVPVVDVEIGAAAALDVDTPEAVRLAGGALQD